MHYNDIANHDDHNFRRLTGVKKATFQRMVDILTEAHAHKKAKGGRPNKLTVPDMLLMALEYLREYRTYLHIGASYGISESNAYQTIRWVEDTLVKAEEFSLPGKKALRTESPEIEVILIDATETPVQRPQKNNAAITRAKRSGTR